MANGPKSQGIAKDHGVDITEDVFKVIDQLKDTVKDAPTHETPVDVVSTIDSAVVPEPPKTE